jgi:hypothetical protein
VPPSLEPFWQLVRTTKVTETVTNALGQVGTAPGGQPGRAAEAARVVAPVLGNYRDSLQASLREIQAAAAEMSDNLEEHRSLLPAQDRASADNASREWSETRSAARDAATATRSFQDSLGRLAEEGPQLRAITKEPRQAQDGMIAAAREVEELAREYLAALGDSG